MNNANPNRRYKNPSCGLNLWGPLIPANDNRKAMALLTGVQGVAGLLLWVLPVRRPPVGRGKWTSRAIKLAGALSGGYLMFMSGIESMRFLLPYDPWVADARDARARLGTHGLLDEYLGPKGYKACPPHEWRRRIEDKLNHDEYVLFGRNRYSFKESKDAAEDAKSQEFGMLPNGRPPIMLEIDLMIRAYTQIRKQNRDTAQLILSQIQAGAFRAPPRAEIDEVDIDDDIDIDTLKFEHLDLWERFDYLAPFSVVLLPQSCFRGPNSSKSSTLDGQLIQRVEYNPIPKIVKKLQGV